MGKFGKLQPAVSGATHSAAGQNIRRNSRLFGKDHDGNEAKIIDAEQGTDSRVEEGLDTEQGADSKVVEKNIDPKDWLKEGLVDRVDENPPELSCAHGVRYKGRNLQKGQYPCRYFFKENHCRNFVLVSKDTCNNRECQVIVNGGSSSRQTLSRGLKRAGWSIRQIAADTHLGASTVHRLWRRWLEQGNVAIYRNVDATRVTSARVDRRILRQAVAAPQATCTGILQHVQDTLDHSISTRTISRRLVANGLHSCRPLRRLPLTPPNRRQRLEWCRARSTWMTEWHRVVFSDESRFCLSSDSRRVRVWRRRGERSNPAAIVERPTVRQRGIMVWGAIAYDSRSPLLRIQGTMTAQRYVDDVLRPVTLPYLQGVPNALYQQDNARPHTARISQQALQDVQMPP
ncbi:hypothetical protein LAZ67_9002653 [Cordylochernes scorpioides]|uniref:Transposase Tc1-like domain-containing protein n=1 Tax=Cordylochernes scorpioides TaxID=51811 RepID=A0ABY6KTY0_9ARAC|nr:hypothetical protein LAZ67_9002653 [Cordylochernes scorpioides]